MCSSDLVFGYTWALMHHLCSGIRHFVWDLGYGFKANEREALTWGALVAGILFILLAMGTVVVLPIALPGIVTGVVENDEPPMITQVVADAIGQPILANPNLVLAAKVL